MRATVKLLQQLICPLDGTLDCCVMLCAGGLPLHTYTNVGLPACILGKPAKYLLAAQVCMSVRAGKAQANSATYA